MSRPVPPRRSRPLLVGAALAVVLAAGPGCGRGGAPAPRGARSPSPAELARDLGWVVQGYRPTRLVAAAQASAEGARQHHVPRELPALDFPTLRRVMLGPDQVPLVADDVRAREGQRVRIEGRALPLDELTAARSFVLHDLPFVRCVHVATPATNRHILVRLAEGVTFDFTDAPLMVEGVLRVGRFATFAEGDVALYALDDAHVEVLPVSDDEMVIGLEHDPAVHDGEVRIPSRQGIHRRYDPGVHQH